MGHKRLPQQKCHPERSEGALREILRVAQNDMSAWPQRKAPQRLGLDLVSAITRGYSNSRYHIFAVAGSVCRSVGDGVHSTSALTSRAPFGTQ
jgi:hypothetical protein